MILLIAFKDLRERLRDGRLYWAGGIVAVLLLTALAVGYLHQQEAVSYTHLTLPTKA